MVESWPLAQLTLYQLGSRCLQVSKKDGGVFRTLILSLKPLIVKKLLALIVFTSSITELLEYCISYWESFTGGNCGRS